MRCTCDQDSVALSARIQFAFHDNVLVFTAARGPEKNWGVDNVDGQMESRKTN